MSKLYYIFNAAFYEFGSGDGTKSQKHADVLLVLLQLMKVLVETDKEAEW